MLHYKLLARGIPSHLKGGKEVTKELMHVIDQAMEHMEMTREPSLGGAGFDLQPQHKNNLQQHPKVTSTYLNSVTLFPATASDLMGFQPVR